MTDPAVIAARKALDQVGYGRSGHVQRVAAAREALKPIREKCDELREAYESDRVEFVVASVAMKIVDLLAPFVYPSEELER